MEDDRQPSDQSASDRLAAFLRDCLLGLIVLAMIGWLLYFGLTGIVTAHLELHSSARLAHRWFTKPLVGPPAVLAGFAFLCLAAAFTSICTAHPLVSRLRLPSWVRISYWGFFAGFAILYVTARWLSDS